MSKLSIFLKIYNKKLQKQKKKNQVRWLFAFNPLAVECLRSLEIKPSSTNEEGFYFSVTIKGVSGVVKEEIFVGGKAASPSSLNKDFCFETFQDMILNTRFIPYERWAFVTNKETVLLQDALQLTEEQTDHFMYLFEDITYEYRTFLKHLSNEEQQKESTRTFLTKARVNSPWT